MHRGTNHKGGVIARVGRPSRAFVSVRELLIVLVVMLVTVPGDDPATAMTDPPPPFRRIAVIGASASAGFGVSLEVRIDAERTRIEGITLGDVLQESGRGRLVILDLASSGFFTNPMRIGAASIERTRQWAPDLTIGLDFLFWYVYGSVDAKASPEQVRQVRLRDLEAGLAQLDRLGMPIVIGEVPDMSPAIGGMLSRRQVPSPGTLVAVNERIRSWAGEREDVVVVPLVQLTEGLRGEAALVIGEWTWDTDREDLDLLLPDRLHPSLDGLIALAQSVSHSIERSPGLSARMPPMELGPDTLKNDLRGWSPPLPDEPSPAAP